MKKLDFDVIVVGLGAVGSAALYQLAKRGKKVLGIDQFSPPHPFGSSHGDTRITRQAVGEGVAYVPLVLRAYEIWDELEKATGRNLLTVTGGLIMSSTDQSMHHGDNFFDQTVACAEQYNIAHRLLGADEIGKEFPQFKLQGSEKGYFEDKAGFLRPEACIEAQLELAQKHGATMALNERVLGCASDTATGKVRVKTIAAEYTARKAILSIGPWISHLLGDKYSKYFSTYRQVLYWFDAVGSIRQFEQPNFPVWIWEFGGGPGDALYGFPAVDRAGGGVKLASEQYAVTTDPGTVSREVTEGEKMRFYDKYVSSHLPGLSDRCVKAAACLYTVTPDFGFVIDTHPEYPDVIVASPCSGHGFKHSAAVGEVLSQMALDGRSKIDVSAFSLRRFAG